MTPSFSDLCKERVGSLLVLFYSFITPLGCKPDIGDFMSSDVLIGHALADAEGREQVETMRS